MNAVYSSLSEPATGALRGWSVLRCEGPDAEAFLQSQLSSDVAGLKPGLTHWSAWLNAKGRVIALLLLMRRDPQTFDMLLPDHPADMLAAQLSRFILRRKARLSQQAHAQVIAGIATAAPTDAVQFAGSIPRWLMAMAEPCESDAPALDLAWKRLDLLTGVPRLSAEGGSHTAHMLGLDRLQAISLSKGCYPGQEIVARTHYLGQSKRSLACLHVDSAQAPSLGAAVLLGEQAVGEVISLASLDSLGHLIQAVISGAQTHEPYACGSASASLAAAELPPLPLP